METNDLRSAHRGRVFQLRRIRSILKQGKLEGLVEKLLATEELKRGVSGLVIASMDPFGGDSLKEEP